jgi:agmatinase
VRARGESGAIDDIVEHLRAAGARAVYFSNDIDGTDAALAPSTGAPEPGGLSQAFVEALVSRLGASFTLLGADLCEVAPPIGSADDRRRTLSVAVSYLRASLRALLGSDPP